MVYSLVVMLLALIAAAGAFAAPPDPPLPDPYPGTPKGTPITWVAYDYDLPAINEKTGQAIPGMYFHCHVPVRWKGKLNRQGHAVCKLRHRP